MQFDRTVLNQIQFNNLLWNFSIKCQLPAVYVTLFKLFWFLNFVRAALGLMKNEGKAVSYRFMLCN